MAYIGHFGWADNVYYRTRPRYLMINSCAKFDDRIIQIIQKLSLYFAKEINMCCGRDDGDGKTYYPQKLCF